MASSSLVLKENLRKAYDSIALKYSEWTRPSYRTRVEYLHKLFTYLLPLPHEKSILELGCGSGYPCTALLASNSSLNVTANDISPVQLALAAQHLSSANVVLLEGDMMDLSFENHSFDAVIAMYSLIHLPREEQVALLTRIYKWLKPGALFLGNFGAGHGDKGSFDKHWLDGGGGVMFWSGWGEARTCEIMTAIGFELILRDIVVDTEEERGERREVPFLWLLGRKGDN
ncbi:S-adenosyl-L-methionine-dependent methyltransferase [Aspergillus leporis]|uniref:S-adenosyl-L-methionine-dependent methyltransferase n=1 Tax=Aspergillus leporis TaxID=41062 RepID=A0A5N5WNX1_9EURO|nr:S-adenosyl-L-methionine-dependent methyltransferase [Aspergillus leporis]